MGVDLGSGFLWDLFITQSFVGGVCVGDILMLRIWWVCGLINGGCINDVCLL